MSLKASEILPQVSASQKDRFYLDYLRSLVNEATGGVFGVRNTLAWNKEVQLLTDAVYFGITTLQDLQTLGEEYTGIIQVDSSLNRLPSIWSRFSMILTRILIPYFLEKALKNAENYVSRHEHLSNNGNLENMIRKVRTIISVINRMHLSAFYVENLYHTLSKRFGDIKYVRYARPGDSAELHSTAFKILGVLSLGQCAISLAANLYSLYKDFKDFHGVITIEHSKVSAEDDDSDSSALRCSLCLARRQHSTTTPCGHLFCWNCIHSWIQTKSECPICRENLQPQKLVCLMNFP